MPLTDGPRPAWPPAAPDRETFTALVRERGAALYRDLPWRNLDDPYAVLVSEIMLQQTQVARVLKHWERWMALFPTVDALAAAGTADVLAQWQGLGYNRRALALMRACEECSARRAGSLPETAEELEALAQGPEDDSLVSLLPEDFAVISSRIENGVCYLNLPASGSLPENEAERDLMLSALEQSILSLGGVDEVQFLIEGSAEPDGYR